MNNKKVSNKLVLFYFDFFIFLKVCKNDGVYKLKVTSHFLG